MSMRSTAGLRRPGDGAVLIIVSGAWGGFWGVWSALLPAVLKHDHTTSAALGLVLTAVPIGATPSMAIAGRLAAGRESRALATALAVMAVAAAVLGLVPGLVGLSIALLLVGAASGGVDVCMNMAIARHERTAGVRLFQRAHAAFPVAQIVAAPAAGLGRQFRLPLAVILAVPAASLATVGALAVGLGVGLRSRADLESASDPRPRPTDRGPRRALLLWGIALGTLGGTTLIIDNATEHWSVLLLQTKHGAPPVLASMAPSVFMASMTVGRLVAQKAPAVRIHHLLYASAVTGCGGMALAASAPTTWGSLLGFAVSGLTVGPVMPALLGHAGRHDASGVLVSIVSATSYGGFVISPALIGTLSRWMPLPDALTCLAALALPLAAAAAGSRLPALARWTAPPGDSPAPARTALVPQ